MCMPAAPASLPPRPLLSVAAALLVAACWSCTSRTTFPALVETHVVSDETILAFDTNHDGQPDYWQYQTPGGRKHAVAFADGQSGQPGPRIEIDRVDPDDCPHFVIAMDGVPFELVKQLYDEGHFRLFHPPARVICCFPSMTDLALSEMFHTGRCLAYQATYYDRAKNQMSSGNSVYLSGGNCPWLAKMDYRCSFWWDVKVYLDPQAVFDHELDGIVKTFRAVDNRMSCAYSVGTAGLGTRGGREAILEYLRTIDRLCEQIVHQRRGKAKITLTADHGHNLVVNRRIKLDEMLKECGYRPSKTIRDDRDVVSIAYGLVTYAALFTRDPAGVADCLLPNEEIEFACYPAGSEIIVRDREGLARIRKGVLGFAYDSSAGDPLKIAPIIDKLRAVGYVSADGEVDGEAMFDATADHYYPDPLARIWGAFHELVENPPDLIVNLRDGVCNGSGFFLAMIGEVTSTHGSLNRMNSTTFALTMLGELPPVMPSRELLPALERLRARRTAATKPPRGTGTLSPVSVAPADSGGS